MQVTFYTFSKEENSTRQPSGTGASYDCLLKDDCGILEPVIELNLGGSSPGSPFKFNYAWIEEFERYYRIVNWEFQRGLWVAYLSVDVLASWREQIGASSQYIVRSAAEMDGSVPDGLYPGTATAIISSIEKEPIWEDVMSADSGTFVIALAGNDISYYATSRSGLTSLLDFVFSEEYLEKLYGLSWANEFKELKVLANPMQYINSLRWYPMIISGVATIPSVGWVEYPSSLLKVNDKMPRKGSITFGKIYHPQSGRGSFLNNAPYSRYSIFVPPFGLLTLDAESYCNSTGVRCDYYVDVRTGMAVLDCFYTHSSGPDSLAFRTSAPFAVEYQLAHLTSQSVGWGDVAAAQLSATGPALSALGNAAGLATGTVDPQAGVSGIAQGITDTYQQMGSFVMDAIASKNPLLNCTGSPGGSAGLMGKPRLDGIFTMMASDDVQHRGRPLCKIRKISSIPGYIMAEDVHLEIPAFQAELGAISAYMTGGFYYE